MKLYRNACAVAIVTAAFCCLTGCMVDDEDPQASVVNPRDSVPDIQDSVAASNSEILRVFNDPPVMDAEESLGESESNIACANAVDIGFTVWDNPWVRTSGSWNRCDNSFTTIRLQLWAQIIGSIYSLQKTVSQFAGFGRGVQGMEARCSGSNRRWYAVIQASDAAGTVQVTKTSNTVSANCGG